MKGVEPNL